MPPGCDDQHISNCAEVTPLLSQNIVGSTLDHPGVSALRVRVVSTIVLVLTMSAASVTDPLMAQYILSRLAHDDGFSNNTEVHPCFSNLSDPRVKETNSLQERTSQQLLYQTLFQTGPAFFACLFVGSYSDYLGRRLVLLVPVITFVVKVTIIAIVIRFGLPLWVFFLAYGVDGLSGSWFTILLALFAVAADINQDHKDRSFAIYFMGFAQTLVGAACYFGNGYMISNVGYFWAAVMLVVMASVSFLVALCFFPETLVHRSAERNLNPVAHLKRLFGLYTTKGSVRRRATLSLCLVIFFLGVIGELVIGSVDARYQIHEPFCWQATRIGAYSAIRGVVRCIGGILFFKLSQRCIQDPKIAMVGILFQSAGYCFEAFIQMSWQFYLVPVILIPGTSTIPIIRSMMSVLAGEKYHGAIFSSVAIVETISNLSASALFNEIFAITVSQWTGAVYIAMSSCSFLAFLLFIMYFCIREGEVIEIKVLDVDPPVNIQEQLCPPLSL